MYQVTSPVISNIDIGNSIHLLEFQSSEIANSIKPGQFLNIKVFDSFSPLLRRPFSVCEVEDDRVKVMFNIFGEGTKILAGKKPGETVDVLGPLGNGFNLQFNEDTVIIVAGGLGAAPFPFVTESLKSKKIITLIGGRTSKDIITHGLKNIKIATDDGSSGFKGNVIELLKLELPALTGNLFRILACGPNVMVKALQNYVKNNSCVVEASIESAMACGFGICQGCPVEHVASPNAYKLICKDGPVFNLNEIVL